MGLRAVWTARQLTVICLGLALLMLSSVPSVAAAEADAVLIRLLSDSRSFRVRARAAVALGQPGRDAGLSALEDALSDRHPAVRMAAAEALGEVGGRRSVAALRTAAGDRSLRVAQHAKTALTKIAERVASTDPLPQAPNVMPIKPSTRSPQFADAALAQARIVVVLGEMRQRAGVLGHDLSADMQSLIASRVRELEHVAVLSLAELTSQRADALARRNISVVLIEASLSRVDGKPTFGQLTTRCEVSLVLLDEHGRTLRVLMKGAATGSEPPLGPASAQRLSLARKTLEGAVASATADLRQAVEGAETHSEVASEEVRADAAGDTHGGLRSARYGRR